MKIWVIILAIIVYLGLNFYVYMHGRWALPRSLAVRIAYSAVFWFCALAMVLARGSLVQISWKAAAVCEVVGGYWIILFCIMLAACLFADLLRAIQHFANFYPAFVKNHYGLAKLTYLGITGAVCAVFVAAGYVNFGRTQVVRLELEVAKKEASLDSLKIVAVSDLHLGSVMRKARLQKWVDAINAQQPDVIVIVGDLIDHSLEMVQAQGLQATLGGLRAKYGAYAVLGNHDYFSNPEQVCEFMRGAGIVPLRDTAVAVGNAIVLAGRDDFSNKLRKPLSHFLENPSPLPVVALDHQPAAPQEAADCGAALHISGHTHGGQAFPITLAVRALYGKYAYGYARTDNMHHYTSCGAGSWGAPMRVGSRSEMACITLKFVQDASAK